MLVGFIVICVGTRMIYLVKWLCLELYLAKICDQNFKNNDRYTLTNDCN